METHFARQGFGYAWRGEHQASKVLPAHLLIVFVSIVSSALDLTNDDWLKHYAILILRSPQIEPFPMQPCLVRKNFHFWLL